MTMRPEQQQQPQQQQQDAYPAGRWASKPTVIEIGVEGDRWVACYNGRALDMLCAEETPIGCVAAELQALFPHAIIRPMMTPPSPAPLRERWRAAWGEWRGLYNRRLSAASMVAAEWGLPTRALMGTWQGDMLAHRMPGRMLNWPKG